MIPPGKTTLFRMQLAAQNEAERIEIAQDGRVTLGMLKQPMPDQVRLRDDFAGIVRLIDAIMSDKALLERVQERKNCWPLAAWHPPMRWRKATKRSPRNEPAHRPGPRRHQGAQPDRGYRRRLRKTASDGQARGRPVPGLRRQGELAAL
jgi:hypothetical protein